MAFYPVAFVCMALQWWLMKCQLDIAYTNAVGTLIKAGGDMALILVPYWILGPRWRWTVLLPVWAYGAWCVCNLAYFRFWGDLIPPAAVTMGGNVDGNLMDYCLSLLRPSDLLYLLIPVCATAAFRLMRVSEARPLSRRLKAAATGLSLLAGLAGQFSYFHTSYQWSSAISRRTVGDGLRDHFLGGYTGQKRLLAYNGIAYYGVRCCVDMVDILTCSVEISAEQRREISDFLGLYGRECGAMPDSAAVDSINVVYIIVESLNAEMIGRDIGGLPVMPVLDSLASAPGTVFFDNVVSQIKASSSSDGHLLLMTGLLPPDKMAYSITYGSHNTFPSLADVLPRHHKYLLLADEGVCWNEGNTLRNFGLGDPIVVGDREGSYDVARLGRDGAMFRQAADMIKDARQPFFMTLMTISMHIPFVEEGWEMPTAISGAGGLTDMEKNYANVCHHTDHYISEFMRALPENTLVFIASDHSQGVASSDDSTPPAVFMAVNTSLAGTAPQTGRISRVVGQVNLFPAALDILGRSAGYGGIAPSAFNPSVVGTRDSYGNVYGKAPEEALDSLDTAFRISDIIIRGDYFSR